MSQEDSMDSFAGSVHSLMTKGILHFIQSSIFLLFQCFYQNFHCNIIQITGIIPPSTTIRQIVQYREKKKISFVGKRL
jgi:hypothetical protein